ncbi:MAG: phosphohydrolase, partial [Fibrobacter sp.]|nr:phosphohydrolase [Fibrobacter sp.]
MKFQKKTIHYLAKAILFIAVGLLLNIVPAKIVTHFELPVFFDCLGTILTAMMCGNMAAVIVGFISNAINGLSDAVTLYYGVINVLIAGCAYLFYQKKFFLSIPKILVVIFTFALIGGGLGSILTYFLYGYSIGEGISAPFAIALRDTCGLPDFWSQLLADIIIDVFDKGIVVISAVLLYRWIPRKIRFACNDTFHIDPNVDELAATTGRSLLRRVVAMVIVAELLLGSLACAIGYFLYQKVSIDKFTDIANGVTQAASVFIDGNRIDEFLTSGREADGY